MKLYQKTGANSPKNGKNLQKHNYFYLSEAQKERPLRMNRVFEKLSLYLM